MSRWLIVLVALALLHQWLKQDEPGPSSPAPAIFSDWPSEGAVWQSQEALPAPFLYRAYHIRPLAQFQVEARVLSRRNYRHDREAELAPVDLALGWNAMARPDILQAFSISQSGRFYRWRTENFPIPRAEVVSSSANMHLIPASPELAQRLQAAKEEQMIRLRGLLVRADADDGWHWVSSLRRDDSGAGACELIWVQELSIY